MQEQRRAACTLRSPAAADLLGDGGLLDPVAFTQRWCDIAENELHFAATQFSWVGNGRNQRPLVGGTATLRSCSRGLLLRWYGQDWCVSGRLLDVDRV